MDASGSWSAGLSAASPKKQAPFETCESPIKIILYRFHIVGIILRSWTPCRMQHFKWTKAAPSLYLPYQIVFPRQVELFSLPFSVCLPAWVFHLKHFIPDSLRLLLGVFVFLQPFSLLKQDYTFFNGSIFISNSFLQRLSWGQHFLRNYRLSSAWNSHLHGASVKSFPNQFWRWWQTELLLL